MTEKSIISLTNSEITRYSRQIVLPDIGYSGQLKLKRSKVCIVGLGGLGSVAAVQLAAMGVGFIRLIDFDTVETSNLQRQHIYSIDLLGYPKVEAAAERIKKLNPHVEVDPRPAELTSRNAEELIKDVDVVVDGLDHMSPRYALNRACHRLKIPYVFNAAIQSYGSVSTIIPGKTACLECFHGGLEDHMLPSCAVAGIHPSILNIVASIGVSEAVKILLGEEPYLANKILYCDLRGLTFEKIEIVKSENCPVCGLNSKEPPKPLEWKKITELCSRDGRRVFMVRPDNVIETNIERLYSKFNRTGLKIRVKTALGITVDLAEHKTMSVLKSGIMIIEGAENETEAQLIYDRTMAETK
ncbi:MAG: HesA/MoeB/ThiF family protein [Candidatus Bathyarchaeia archaeon]